MKDKQLTALEKLASLQEEANRRLSSIERLLEKQSKPEPQPIDENELDEKVSKLMTKSGPISFGEAFGKARNE